MRGKDLISKFVKALLSWISSRKEVIQPHLPVRLPCYDLAPVTCSTLTGFCDEHQLQVYQTSMA